MIFEELYQEKLFNIKVTLFGILLHCLGMQVGWVFENPGINNPTWYISVLLICYIIFYIICRMSKRFNISLVYFCLCMIFTGIGLFTYKIDLPFLTMDNARGYYSFFTGIILADILQKYKYGKKITVFSFLIIITVPILLKYAYEFTSYGLQYILTFIYYPALIILFLSKPVSDLFNKKIIGVLAGISFNVYMLHASVIIMFFLVQKLSTGFLEGGIDLHRLRYMYLYIFCCFVIGTISHFFIEKPLIKVFKEKNLY